MKSVLVTEDCRVFQMLFRSALKDDYDVYMFDNAEDSLEATEMIIFDLIITDCNLPGMSGIRLIDMTSDYRRKNCIPIILSTSDPKQTRKAELRGAFTLKKPFKQQDLIDKIKEVENDKINNCP